MTTLELMIEKWSGLHYSELMHEYMLLRRYISDNMNNDKKEDTSHE